MRMMRDLYTINKILPDWWREIDILWYRINVSWDDINWDLFDEISGMEGRLHEIIEELKNK